jgi:hypothetical protein
LALQTALVVSVVGCLQHHFPEADKLSLVAVKGEDHRDEHGSLPKYELPLPPVIEKNERAQCGYKKKTDFPDTAKHMASQNISPEAQARLKTVCKPVPSCIITIATKPIAKSLIEATLLAPVTNC